MPAVAQLMQGDLAGAVAEFGAVAAECEAAHDETRESGRPHGPGHCAAHRGDVSAARDRGRRGAARPPPSLGEYFLGMGHAASAAAALAAGDVAAAQTASEAAWQCLSVAQPEATAAMRAFNAVDAALAGGDLDRGPPLGRRGRRGGDGLAPGGGTTGPRPRGDCTR